MRSTVVALVTAASIILTPALASAHVVVKPASVGVGSFQIFTMSVPVEKDQPTTALKLITPTGLQYVTPTVKAGWTIDTKTAGDSVTEIDWTGGFIPAERRDDFTFSAQVPAKASTLNWKVYQTYQDGTVVSWDVTPSSKISDDDSGNTGSYSITTVVNDLSTATSSSNNSGLIGAYALSGLALLIATIGIFTKRR